MDAKYKGFTVQSSAWMVLLGVHADIQDRSWLCYHGYVYSAELLTFGIPLDTLPWQWSLITISQDNHSFHPMFPTDHCRLVSIFRRKVRWRSEHVYTRITDTCRLT